MHRNNTGLTPLAGTVTLQMNQIHNKQLHKKHCLGTSGKAPLLLHILMLFF